jgi:hypothetical protein
MYNISSSIGRASVFVMPCFKQVDNTINFKFGFNFENTSTSELGSNGSSKQS